MIRLAFLLPALDFLRECIATVQTGILLSVARSEVPGDWRFMRGSAWLRIGDDVEVEATWSRSRGWRVGVTTYADGDDSICFGTHENLRTALIFAIADAPDAYEQVTLYLKEPTP